MQLMKFVDLENINWFWIVIGFLATWRLTSIIHVEGIASGIRAFFNGHEDEEGTIHYLPINILGRRITFFAKLLSCFACLSVWVGLLVTALILVFPWILLPFALSTVAIIVERLWDF